jgi:hypothetical protein|tara:strand:- start:1217 stop:1717 length:501 start_codon:yes stop_codon:yes gene_type:complete
MAELTENFNYMQPTSFKLVIDRRNYPNLEFFCQNVTHPGMIMNPVELPVRRLAGLPFPGETLTFNELSTNILLDENLESYTEMFNWIRRLLENNMFDRNASGKSSQPNYADITLSILSSHNNQTKQVRYIDCVPTSLGDINFESTSSGQEFITFAASFRFNYFELV